MFLMSVLTLTDGLCCAWLIYTVLVVMSGDGDCVDWAQLSNHFNCIVLRL
jgi:hypothetical protein